MPTVTDAAAILVCQLLLMQQSGVTAVPDAADILVCQHLLME
jgi:hypothetical protein